MAMDLPNLNLPELVSEFIYQQAQPPPQNYPNIIELAHSFKSAVATFYAPSDHSGYGGMHRQRIHATSSWKKNMPRYDCVFAEKDSSLPGFQGLYVAQVLSLFSFKYLNHQYGCALVRWFNPIGNQPCPHTGMWMVEPEDDDEGTPLVTVISLESILRPAHLIPIYGNDSISPTINHSNSLSSFSSYYVNKFSDYHAYQLAF